MANPLKKTMVYLGLADEEVEYERAETVEAAPATAHRAPVSPVQPVQQPGAGPDDGPGLQGGPGQGGEKFVLQSRQDLGQVPVRAEDAVGQDQNPSPFPSSWAAPAAQVWMSRTPTRPRMVR